MASVTDKFLYAEPDWTGTIGAGGVADSSVTTIPLASATGLTNGKVYVVTIDRVNSGGTATAAKKEVIVGLLSGTDLTNCVRGFEGTAQAHDAGAVVEIIFTAGQWDRLIEGLVAEHNVDGTHSVIDYTAIKQNIVTATDGATVTFNLNTSNVFSVTLEGNRTLALSNVAVGQCFILRLVQDGDGSRTVTWFETIKWAGGSAPTLTTTASKTDVFGFICTGTGAYDGFVVGQNL